VVDRHSPCKQQRRCKPERQSSTECGLLYIPTHQTSTQAFLLPLPFDPSGTAPPIYVDPCSPSSLHGLRYPLEISCMTEVLPAHLHAPINLSRAWTASRLHLLCNPVTSCGDARISHSAINLNRSAISSIDWYARIPHRTVHFCHCWADLACSWLHG